MKILKNRRDMQSNMITDKVDDSKDIKNSACDHIKCAIDLLSHSDNDITRDIIANLGVILLDIKSSE